MKTGAILVAVAALVAGGGAVVRSFTNSGGQSAIADGALFTVRRGKLTVTITENGSLMAKKSEKVTSSSRRGGKITYLIDEGKTVEKDEVLCKLDTTDLEQKLQENKLSVVKTQADLETAQTNLEIQKTDNVANVEKAIIALDKAEKDLEKYRDGDAPKERRTLVVSIKEAQTTYSRAKRKYEDSVKLLEQDYINKSQVEQDEIEYERADIQLDGAKRDLELFEKYTLPMTMTEKEAALRDARRSLDNAGKRGKSVLRQKEVAVESLESRLKTLNKKLDEVKEDIEKFIIKAPTPGIVIYGDPERSWYRDRIKLGNHVWGGFTLFTIPDLRVMQVQVQIHEADINKIKLDQAVTVTMDTYPGLVLKGKITKIATIAGNPERGGTAEVKKFTVDITLDSTGDMTLKPGISAKAEVFIDERQDVLFVPLQCVFLEEGVHYAYVLGEGAKRPRRVPVKPEISNDNYIQIVEGLEQGDRVLLYNPALQALAEASAAAGSATVPPPPPGNGAKP